MWACWIALYSAVRTGRGRARRDAGDRRARRRRLSARWCARSFFDRQRHLRDLPLNEAFLLAYNARLPGLLPVLLGAGRPLAAATASRELAAQTAELRREREENARRAVLEERVRIARELHDVVAHHVSVMGVQAGAARRVMARPARPGGGGAQLDRGVQPRRRCVELHRLLGLPAAGRPGRRAGAAAGPVAAAGADRAGRPQGELTVELSVEGEPRPLPAHARGLRLPRDPGGADQRAASTRGGTAGDGARRVRRRRRSRSRWLDDGDVAAPAAPAGQRARADRHARARAPARRPPARRARSAGGFACTRRFPLNGQAPRDDPRRAGRRPGDGARRLPADPRGRGRRARWSARRATARRRSRSRAGCSPHVVLMDVQMPRLDGLEATRRLSRDPGVAQRASSSSRPSSRTTTCSRRCAAGASGFLLKNGRPGGARARRAHVAAGEALLAPSVTRRLIAEYAQRPARPRTPTSIEPLTERERRGAAAARDGHEQRGAGRASVPRRGDDQDARLARARRSSGCATACRRSSSRTRTAWSNSATEGARVQPTPRHRTTPARG